MAHLVTGVLYIVQAVSRLGAGSQQVIIVHCHWSRPRSLSDQCLLCSGHRLHITRTLSASVMPLDVSSPVSLAEPINVPLKTMTGPGPSNVNDRLHRNISTCRFENNISHPECSRPRLCPPSVISIPSSPRLELSDKSKSCQYKSFSRSWTTSRPASSTSSRLTTR